MPLNDIWPTKHHCLQGSVMANRANQIGTFYEFFAGGGMARAGLGSLWNCVFSNEISEKKAQAYTANWGSKELLVKDVAEVCTCELPGTPDLTWASFPCQDLSLAGLGAGLSGDRSGTFWPFWKLMQRLQSEGRSPKMIVLENVCGTLTSHDGADFRSLIEALRLGGYKCGAVVVDAVLFVPQSRPRLFIIGVRKDIEISGALLHKEPQKTFHTQAVITAYQFLSYEDRSAWLWWNVPAPTRRQKNFAEVIEDDLVWHGPETTQALLDMMSTINRAKVDKAKRVGRRLIGAVYKRTRPDGSGNRVQRAEVRFDDVAGCLRTPGGGSSRQSILVIEGGEVRSRLLSPREAARLMGLPDRYILPEKYNDAYHLMGDGVAVPVVRHLARYILEPLLLAKENSDQQAA